MKRLRVQWLAVALLITQSHCIDATLDSKAQEKLHEFALASSSAHDTVYNTYSLAHECIVKGIQGDFVECGVAKGSQTAAMAYACQRSHIYDKYVHLYDSFEGTPLAGPNDDQQPGVGRIVHPVDMADLNDLLMSSHTIYRTLGDASAVSLESVQRAMMHWGLQSFRLVYHKGWFQEVLPVESAPQKSICVYCEGQFYNVLPPARAIPKSICLLRLDGNLYESTKVCLEYLYPKISPGGYVVIGDYSLAGCRKAVNEYLDKHNLNPTRIAVPGGQGAVYWQVK